MASLACVLAATFLLAGSFGTKAGRSEDTPPPEEALAFTFDDDDDELALLTDEGEGVTLLVNGVRQRTRKIEDLEEGDVVLALDESTGRLVPRGVLHVFERVADHLQILRIRSSDGSEQTIKTTDEHPFLVDQKGWVNAGDLEYGDQVREPDGKFAVVIGNVYEPHPEGVTVYNFEVEHDHNYFVIGNEARGPPVLVHNPKVPKLYKGKKPVLLGRNMKGRVNPVAKAKGYHTYNVKGKPTVPKNKRWLRDQVRQGRRVYDIGQPKGYKRSDFYDAERKWLRDHDFEMARRGPVDVDGKRFQVFEWVKRP